MSAGNTKTYVTFGQAHVHVIGDNIFDKDCVAVINHDSSVDGRALAFECFGQKFCFEYPEKEFKGIRMEYFPRGVIEVNPIDNRPEDPLEWSKRNGLEEY